MNRALKLVTTTALALTLLLSGCSASPEPIADDVWANIQEAFPDGIETDSPLIAVNGVEDVSSGTIRVNVQQNLTDAERQEIADLVHGLGYVEELETIVVRDASGLDSNHFFD